MRARWTTELILMIGLAAALWLAMAVSAADRRTAPPPLVPVDFVDQVPIC